MSKSDRTRQYIIEKTAPIFNAKGYAGTSLSDMIVVTGLTKGGIYGNFDGKDDVALAAFDFNFGKIVHLLRQGISCRQGAIEKLLVYPDTYRNFLKIPFLKAGCPLMNTSVEADDTHPLLKQRAQSAMKLWRNSVERIITNGVNTGEIRAEVIPSQVATILMSLIEGAVMQAKLSGKSNDLHVTMGFLENLIRDLRT
jgi:AcrR family transcriptional regulator